MKRRNFLSLCLVFFCSLLLTISCSPSPETTTDSSSGKPVVIGYSSWAGWWPWAIAEQEGLFKKHGANVELKWFDGYLESMKAFSAGQLDGNCQTLTPFPLQPMQSMEKWRFWSMTILLATIKLS